VAFRPCVSRRFFGPDVKPWENSRLETTRAGSRDVRGTAPRSCTDSSRKLFGLNRLLDSALRPSRRFARSVRKAFIVHEESVSYERPIPPY
jgi:hypothetical protein